MVQQRKKTGGRKRGTPNKKTLDVQERLRKLGCDPIEGMVMLALDEDSAPELKGRMYAELAQYLYPKRKAIEHSNEGSEALRLIVRSVLDPMPE